MKKTIMRHLSNLPGWRTSRKIIVFESDDWGSIRMPSNEAFNSLKAKGVDLTSGDAARYNMYDTLATKDDLSALFEVLHTIKDINGNPVVFTPVTLVANPDFEKIREAKFNEYFYEPFTETLRKYGREDAFLLWQEGAIKRLFVPQFHGREHLNVQVWLRALQKNDKHTHLAFEQGVWGFRNNLSHKINFQAAFNLEYPDEIEYQKSVIAEGLEVFEKLHGYKATFFVPPNGSFNSRLEEISHKNGIKYISTSKIHPEPQGNQQFKKKYYWIGKKNSLGQIFITRNAFFEPSQPGKDWVDNCLREIDVAFKLRKPITISTHRVNYIGSREPANRDIGLGELKRLLLSINKKWPNVEFMTSHELGTLIENKK